MCLFFVPHPVKETQEKQGVGWDWAALLLLLASKFKQQHLHLSKDGLEGARENSCPVALTEHH